MRVNVPKFKKNERVVLYDKCGRRVALVQEYLNYGHKDADLYEVLTDLNCNKQETLIVHEKQLRRFKNKEHRR